MTPQDFRLADGREGDRDRAVREGQGCCITYAQLQKVTHQCPEHTIYGASIDTLKQWPFPQQQCELALTNSDFAFKLPCTVQVCALQAKQ